MQTQFKNNADQIIGSISYTYKVDDKTTYLSCQETLLPGQVSTMQETFGPTSGDIKDVKLVETTIYLKDENGNTTFIVDYDHKTKKYNWF